MKRFVIAVSVVVLVFGVAILAQTKSGSVEQELIKLETEWGDAWVMRDVAAIDRILADDFIGTGADGNVFTKAQGIANIKSGEGVPTSVVGDDNKVRVYGDVAVVMGRITFKLQSAGKEATVQERYTDTWVKRGGRWQCVAGHNSRVAQK